MIFHLVFFFFSICLIFSSLFVLFSKNPVHSVLFLILVFCNGSAILLLLEAEFIGLIYIVIYIGAIAVLFLFVVMMLNIKIIELSRTFFFLPVSVFFGFLLLFLLLQNLSLFYSDQYFFRMSFFEEQWIFFFNSLENLVLLGVGLYIYDFVLIILAGLLLLLAMLGVISLTLLTKTQTLKQDIYQQHFRQMNKSFFLY